jgi:AcrR family transcriptional regulator
MRVDAARNIELVLTTAARMLARDPTATIAAIATEAGVDRRTVYNRFDSRETLLAAIYQARLDEVEKAVDDARLTEAPVTVALHRYVEGIISATRRWPVELERMRADAAIHDRRAGLIQRVNNFIQRATDEGLFRADLPKGWVESLMRHIVHVAAHEHPEIPAAKAADFVVDSLLHGAGQA